MSIQSKRIFKTTRRPLSLEKKTHIVGILNLTPDSFSDGGQFEDLKDAEAFFCEMARQGASIIDIGGESTRPNHKPVSIDEEINRILPFLEMIRGKSDCLISIDTSKSEVAEVCLQAGADIINDVWGAQRDKQMARVIAKYDAACILMHNRSDTNNSKLGLIKDVIHFLAESISIVTEAGVAPQAICVDPGLGFGKSFEDNWTIMRNLEALKALAVPVLIGASRKSMIAQLLNIDKPKDRIFGTLGTTALASSSGVDFIRVHDVSENIQCTKVIDYCKRYEEN